VAPAVRSVLAAGRDVVAGCARGVDRAVAAEVVGSGLAERLGVFAVAPVPAESWAAAAAAAGASVVWVPRSAGRAAFAVRSRLVLAAALAGGPGGGLVAFPGGPCPAACLPDWGAAPEQARVSGGGSGTWLAIALAVGAGLPAAVFLSGGVPVPPWPGASWAGLAELGVWSRAVSCRSDQLRFPGWAGGIPFGGSRPSSWGTP
jgi:hypothetical protein